LLQFVLLIIPTLTSTQWLYFAFLSLLATLSPTQEDLAQEWSPLFFFVFWTNHLILHQSHLGKYLAVYLLKWAVNGKEWNTWTGILIRGNEAGKLQNMASNKMPLAFRKETAIQLTSKYILR
jgi:hypothetical protein